MLALCDLREKLILNYKFQVFDNYVRENHDHRFLYCHDVFSLNTLIYDTDRPIISSSQCHTVLSIDTTINRLSQGLHIAVVGIHHVKNIDDSPTL